MTYINTFAFGIWPYIAGTILIVGSICRSRWGQWSAGSSQFLRKKQLRLGSLLFHGGLLALLAGHLFGLLTPASVYHEIFGLAVSSKQLTAVIAGGGAGICCFAGLSILLYRRLADPRLRATSSFGDIAILVLLQAILILGLASLPVSLAHRDGSQMLLMCEWAQRLVSFRSGAADLLLGVHWIFKLHIFLGVTLAAVFPFSRLVHVLSLPLGYLRRPYQIVRRR